MLVALRCPPRQLRPHFSHHSKSNSNMTRTTKQLLASLVIIFTAFTSQAATVSLAWDANPPSEQITQYTLYELIGATWTKLQDIPSPTTTVVLPSVAPGVHIYAVTASNIFGESERSNEVATPDVSTPPQNLRTITITLTVQ